MGVESATCLSPQGELSRVPPATEHRKEARRAPALEAPVPMPPAQRVAATKKQSRLPAALHRQGAKRPEKTQIG